MKKILSTLLSLCMLFSITAGLDFSAQAATILCWPVPGHKNLSQGLHENGAIDIWDSNISGATVVAALDGTVTKKYTCTQNHYGDNNTSCYGYGTGLVIKGSDGRTYGYAHMKGGSIPSSVKVGAKVSKGQTIGKVGNTGNSSGAHLHFKIAGANPLNETYDNTTQCTVTFKGNGADYVSASSVKVNSGSALGDNIATATRAGYTFDGWYTATSGGTKYSTGSPKVEKNITLYAQWKANELPLEYNRIYRFVNVNSGLAIEADSSENKAAIKQRTVSNSYDQLWKAYMAGDGEYVLRLVNGGRYMDLSGGSNALKTPFQIFNEASSSNYKNQCFTFINRGSGKYSIHSAKSGRAWDISGASKDIGAQLLQYYYYNGTNQQFYIQEYTNRDITFYDNLSNNYFVSLESDNASNSFKTRASSYVTCSVDKIRRMLTINALKAGSSSNSMTWWTTCNNSYNYEMGSFDEYDSVANLKNGKKYLIFRAKSNVNGAKINFRWGYDSSSPIATATLSTSYQVFCLEMPRTENSGHNIHPWVDRACTIQMDNILLVDSTDDYNIHLDDSSQSVTYNINSNNGYFPTSLPDPKSTKSDCHFLGWYSKRVGGYKIKSAYYMQYNQKVYAHWEEHRFDNVSYKVEPTCTTGGYTVYSCSCGATQTRDYVDATGHSFSNVAYKVEPTCTSGGSTTYACSCGETETRDYVDATGHNFGDNSPTCLSCGEVNPNYVAPQPETVYNNVANSTSTSQKAKVKPKSTSLKKLKKGKKAFKAVWAKKSGVTGYQLQYSTNKKFKKNKKTVTIKGAKKTTKTIKKLKSKKKYYVRVRTYKKVNGKKYYSSWSKVKKITTK